VIEENRGVRLGVIRERAIEHVPSISAATASADDTTGSSPASKTRRSYAIAEHPDDGRPVHDPKQSLQRSFEGSARAAGARAVSAA
jgi:hypothetical protein